MTAVDTTIAHYIITDAPGHCGPDGAYVHRIVQTSTEAAEIVRRDPSLRYHYQSGSEYAWKVGCRIPALYSY